MPDATTLSKMNHFMRSPHGRGQLPKDREGYRVGRARRQIIKALEKVLYCFHDQADAESLKTAEPQGAGGAAAAEGVPAAPGRASPGPGRFGAYTAGRAATRNVNPVLKKDQGGCGDQDSESKR